MALKITAFIVALLAINASAQELEAWEPTYTIFIPAEGADFETREPVYESFKSAEDFVARWPRSDFCDEPCARTIVAPIDFAHSMLIVIALRDRGQQTYDVVIHDIARNEGYLDVTFLELRHGQSRGEVLCGVLMVMPKPTVAVLVPQSTTSVRFFRKRADVICETPVQLH